MAAIIEVNHLSKNFGNFEAVKDLSFTVEEGDVYGFLGQNGAGKSTTIRMLLTLIQPASGEIKIMGKSLSKNRYKILQQTGAVIERPDLYQYLSAIENLFVFARLSGLKTNRFELLEKLKQVGLDERANSKVRTFSQGMKQRLGIAVALVHNPSLIVLDEPTNGLDPQGIADMRNLIRSLSSEHGKTVVVSSHLLSEIEQIATRMIIIDKGKKIVEGSVSALLDPSQTILEINTLDNNSAYNWFLNSEWANCLVPDSTQKIVLKLNKVDIPSVALAVVQSGIGLLSLQPMNRLEEYFLAITKGNQHVDIN
jgi:ABC-type multidrug transport system ATPase subunit